MITFYQLLDSEGTNKILVLQVAELNVIPNMGENFCINDNEFVVAKVKHVLDTVTMGSGVEIHLMTEDLFEEAMKEEIEYHIEYTDGDTEWKGR